MKDFLKLLLSISLHQDLSSSNYDERSSPTRAQLSSRHVLLAEVGHLP